MDAEWIGVREGVMPKHINKKRIRVLIVEDDAIAQLGLRMLIGNNPKMAVVGETGNRSDALAIAARGQPDIILLDLDMGDFNFMRQMLDTVKGARILVLTSFRQADNHKRAVRLGAMGLILKENAEEVLVKAIEKVYAGEVWLDRSLTASVLADFSRLTPPQERDPEAAKIARLTQREHDIIPLVCNGLHNNQIGDRLLISEATVRNHLTSILSKLGLSDRFELAIYSFRHGLAEPPG